MRNCIHKLNSDHSVNCLGGHKEADVQWIVFSSGDTVTQDGWLKKNAQQRTSSIHVTTVSRMYGSTSVCRQQQSAEGRLLCSVASKLERTRSSVTSVRHWNARRQLPRPVSTSSSSSRTDVQFVVASSTTLLSSRHISECSTAHIVSRTSRNNKTILSAFKNSERLSCHVCNTDFLMINQLC